MPDAPRAEVVKPAGAQDSKTGGPFPPQAG